MTARNERPPEFTEAQLDRLVQEALDSGPPIPWEEARETIRKRILELDNRPRRKPKGP